MNPRQHLIQEIRLRDFRCFHEEHAIPVAPFTLLFGENSTGKTSFLAAVRAIWQTAFKTLQPNFRDPPYDLGSFSEIVHTSDQAGVKPSYFEIGFSSQLGMSRVDFDVRFGSSGSAPFPVAISMRCDDSWIRLPCTEEKFLNVEFGTGNGSWRYHGNDKVPKFFLKGPSRHFWSEIFYLFLEDLTHHKEFGGKVESIGKNEASFDKRESASIEDLLHRILHPRFENIFAGAPIRSSPRRIYDSDVHSPEPAGSHVPAFLAEMYGDEGQWHRLKEQLERFGRDSGLFHEIGIKRFEDIEGSPFRLEISKENGDRRNLIDVGYGISQILPVIYELFREDGPPIFLFQQPEVHLHPSAQAALGSLFCDIASSGRQAIVETHSDYILDRVLLDIRDKTTKLTARDVSILYFENEGGHATIHPIRIDDVGNVLETPDGYRKFFSKELDRLINY